MAKLRAIALTAFQETLRRRVILFVFLAVALVVAGILTQLYFLHMASAAGEMDIVSDMQAQFVQQALGTWNFAAAFLALFLGAIGISSEVAGKTIVNVFSRPVGRSTFLFGRWLGILAFLWCFLLIGVLAAQAVSFGFHVRWNALAWLAVAQMAVRAAYFSGVALGLSVLLPPVLAGSGAFFLMIVPGLVVDFTRHPVWIWRWLARAAYYLAPASMPDNLLGESFSRELLHPDYGLYGRVLLENGGYAIAVLLLASIVFRRRELKLR